MFRLDAKTHKVRHDIQTTTNIPEKTNDTTHQNLGSENNSKHTINSIRNDFANDASNSTRQTIFPNTVNTDIAKTSFADDFKSNIVNTIVKDVPSDTNIRNSLSNDFVEANFYEHESEHCFYDVFEVIIRKFVRG